MRIKIGEALVASGVLTQAQLRDALQIQLLRGGLLGTTLIEKGYVDEATVGRTLAKLLGMAYAPPEMFRDIPRAALDAIPREEAVRRQIVPLGIENGSLHVAVMDRGNLSTLSELTGYTIVPYVAPEMRILEALERHYGSPRRLRFLAPLASANPVNAFGRRDPSSGARPRPAPGRKPAVAVPTPLEELALRMSRVQTHAELGEVLLDCALRGCERRLLFAVTGDVAEVVNTKNVKLSTETLNGLRLPVDGESIFALATDDAYYRGPLPAGFKRRPFYGRLSLSVPREILVLPIHGEQRLEAVLYGDGGTTGRIREREDSYLPLLGMIGLAVRMLNLRVQLCPS